jgi:hypothetical protein
MDIPGNYLYIRFVPDPDLAGTIRWGMLIDLST